MKPSNFLWSLSCSCVLVVIPNRSWASDFPPGNALLEVIKSQKEFSDSRVSISNLKQFQKSSIGPAWQPDITVQNQLQQDLAPYVTDEELSSQSLTNSASLDLEWNLYDGGLESAQQKLLSKEVESRSLQLEEQVLLTAESIGGLLLSLHLNLELNALAEKQLVKRQKALRDIDALIRSGRRARQENTEQKILLLQAEEKRVLLEQQISSLRHTLKLRQADSLVADWKQFFSQQWVKKISAKGQWQICEGQDLSVQRSLAWEQLRLRSVLVRKRMQVADLQGTARPSLDFQVGIGVRHNRTGELSPNHFAALQFRWQLHERTSRFESSVELAEELALIESQQDLELLRTHQKILVACTRLNQASMGVELKNKILDSENTLLMQTEKKYRQGAIGDFERLSRQISRDSAAEAVIRSAAEERMAFFLVWLLKRPYIE